MDKYRISSTGNSINYLPQYIAEHQGFFEEVGLDVETNIPTSWPTVLDEINSGDYHAVCGGIWVPSMYQHHSIHEYSCFAKISSKCPFKLVTRKQEIEFDWKQLEGKSVLVPCDGGASGYIFLKGTLIDKGVNTDKIHFIHDFVDKMLYDGFTKGNLGDYYFTQASNADQIVSEKKGIVVAEMAKDGIVVPWSIYYSTKEVAADPRKLNHRFALGIQKGLDWLLTHSGKDVADILQQRWPKNDVNVGIETVDRFISEGMWSNSIEIGKTEYETYGRYQVDARIIENIVEFESLVDQSVIDYVRENTQNGSDN